MGYVVLGSIEKRGAAARLRISPNVLSCCRCQLHLGFWAALMIHLTCFLWWGLGFMLMLAHGLLCWLRAPGRWAPRSTLHAPRARLAPSQKMGHRALGRPARHAPCPSPALTRFPGGCIHAAHVEACTVGCSRLYS